MKAIIMPGFSELIIIINPVKKVTREGLISAVMPWLYAPWPETTGKGIIEIDFEGNTLRDLIETLSNEYHRVNVDLEFIDKNTNDIDSDFSVILNNKNYAYLPNKLDTVLRDGDEIKIKILWRWDG